MARNLVTSHETNLFQSDSRISKSESIDQFIDVERFSSRLFKVNHFPGSFQIGRKDRLWRNLSHMQAVHSRREFDFVPQTFVLPADLLLFRRVFEETIDTKECKWIIKPVRAVIDSVH